MPAVSPGRVAPAHEWLSRRAGSGETFEAIASIFPDAELQALTVNPGLPLDLGARAVHATLAKQYGPLCERRGILLPAMPLLWRIHAAGASYDLAITSSHACVKGFRLGRKTCHLCSCHTLRRYVWDPRLAPRPKWGCGTPVVGLRSGGLIDTVSDGATGVLVEGQSATALAAVLGDRVVRPRAPVARRENSERFSPERFMDRFARLVDTCGAQ